MAKIIKWGILGSGAILNRWMPGALQVNNMEIIGIASRSYESAKRMAEYWNIPRIMSYDEMLDNHGIDIVYIPVPHQAHHDLAIKAMNSGKSVLVEKPAAVSAHEFEDMIDCARRNNVFLMEAVWTAFFPAMNFLKALLRQGEIGDVRLLQASFSYKVPDDYSGRVTDPNCAGGSLLDVGVYDLHFSNIVFDKKPIGITGKASKNMDALHLQVDEQAAFIAQYDKGELAVLTSGIRTKIPEDAYIYGSNGSIFVPRFWSPDKIIITKNGESKSFNFPIPQKVPDVVDEGYQYEISHVNECLRAGVKESSIVPHSSTINVLTQCDFLRKEWNCRYPFES